jgi:hypothetical protein
VTNSRTVARGRGLILVAVTMVSLAACATVRGSPPSVSTSTPPRGPTTMVPGPATTVPSIPSTTTLIPPDASPQPEPLLQFASLSSGWMVDPTMPGRILGTTSGGRSWWTSYRGAVVAHGPGAVESIDFVNPSDGWALLYGEGMIATTNGGHTWSAPEEPPEGLVVTVAFTGRGPYIGLRNCLVYPSACGDSQRRRRRSLSYSSTMPGQRSLRAPRHWAGESAEWYR